MRIGENGWPMGFERRKRARLPLHWTVHLSSNRETHPLQTKTMNISSQGFYCTSTHSFTPGEKIDCDILIPISFRAHGDLLMLRCQAVVLRVETSPVVGVYGLACRIDDYSVINPNGTQDEVAVPVEFLPEHGKVS